MSDYDDEEEDFDDDDDEREVNMDRGALDDMLLSMKPAKIELRTDNDDGGDGAWREDLIDEPGEAGRLEYENKWRWCRLQGSVLLIGRTDDPDGPDVRKELKLAGATIEQSDEFIAITPHKKDEAKELMAPSDDDAAMWVIAFKEASMMASAKKKKNKKKKNKKKKQQAKTQA